MPQLTYWHFYHFVGKESSEGGREKKEEQVEGKQLEHVDQVRLLDDDLVLV